MTGQDRTDEVFDISRDSLNTPNYARSRVPRYLQVAAAMRRRIELGQWLANDRIPALPELQQEFAVARSTVRQAINVLEGEGLLRPVQGAGTFVRETLPEKRWLHLDLRWDAIASFIGTNVPRFLRWETGTWPDAGALSPDRLAGSYCYLVSQQFRDEAPFSFARAHVWERIVAKDPDAFRRRPALAVIAAMDGLDVATARQSFVIGAADAAIADHLNVGIGSPTAEAHVEVENGAGKVIYMADIIYRGDCVRLDIDLLR